MTDIQISGFEMLEKLGQGGMATVWKARQLSLDRTVAIKILSAHLASDPDDVKRFQQESQSAAKLKHPGIVQVYDANIENGLYFFVMEFIAGYTCGDWQKRSGQLGKNDVLLVADCVADALGYAWDREKMVHCDIKPDNIMIDDDGTVKVMDLGLARTIHTMSADDSDDILGTPSYMSPEQALGEPGLDCRSDMYSLGAMLYHLATGTLPFGEYEPQAAMECQIQDVIPNPKDLKPSLSKGFCRLIEVMMAKQPDGRPDDWQQVREAIRRVRKGLMPGLKLPDGVISTVAPHEVPDPLVSHSPVTSVTGQAVAEQTKSSVLPFVIVGLVIAGLIGAFLMMQGGGSKAPRRRQPSTTSSDQRGTARPPTANVARQLYNRASAWEKRNPTDYDAAITRYRKIVSEHSDSPYAARARLNIERLQRSKQEQAIEDVIGSLKRQADHALANHDFDTAIQLYETYTGEFAAETQARRMAMASEAKNAQAEWKERERVRLENEKQARIETLLENIAQASIAGDFSTAVLSIEQSISDGTLSAADEDMMQLLDMLKNAVKVDNTILDSFATQKGEQITVDLATGSKTLVINNVKDGVVYASEVFNLRGGTGSRPESFTLDDLSIGERIKRMGSEDLPHVCLAKGVMAYALNSFEHARRFFTETDALIADRLLAFVDAREKQMATESMIASVNKLMRKVGLMPGNAFNAVEWARMIRDAELSPMQADALKRSAALLQQEYQSFDRYEQVADVVSAMMAVKSAREDTAPAPAPRRDPVELPAVELPDDIVGLVGNPNAVLDRLLEDNRLLESGDIYMRRDREGHVIGIRIRSNDLDDIRAVAALRNLHTVEFRTRNRREQAPLKDLTPLAGMPLETVIIDGAKVDDLEPLRNLPIRTLRVPRTHVRDLSPISEMQLENVDVSGTRVFDFKPLSAMPIKSFAANQSQLRDLGFMRRWQLESLELADTSVFDFSVVSRMPLKHLNMANTQVRKLDMLRDCPLEELNISGTRVADLSALKDLADTLRRLTMNELPARDFEALRALDLKSLSLVESKFDDIELIAHMQLAYLNLKSTSVKTIEGLDVSQLAHLNIDSTKVESLAPLQNARALVRLHCQNTKIRNFHPIQGSNITHLFVDDPERKTSIFRRLPALETVNWMERFW